MSPVYVVGMLGFFINVDMPMCAPTEYTIYIERQECNYCVAVNTTICMGFCFSRDSNVKELVGPCFLVQRGCTYQEVPDRHLARLPFTCRSTLHLSGGTFPLQHQSCNTHSDECPNETNNSGMKCSKPVRYLYPENNYIQPYWEQYE